MPMEDVAIALGRKLLHELKFFRNEHAYDVGLKKKWLYWLEAQGEIRQVSRGVWCDGDDWPDDLTIAEAVTWNRPRCLLSAAAVYQLCDEPKDLWLAIRHGARPPRHDLPIRVVRMSEPSYSDGLTRLPCSYGTFSSPNWRRRSATA